MIYYVRTGDINIKGHGNFLSAACDTLTTIFINQIVENFKKGFFITNTMNDVKYTLYVLLTRAQLNTKLTYADLIEMHQRSVIFSSPSVLFVSEIRFYQFQLSLLQHYQQT